jgi:hypothetical protein
MSLYSLTADIIVVIHAVYVSFVFFGLFAILAGIMFRWKWIRSFWFRAVHLAMIGIIVFESLLGITCPLTTWEHRLRAAGGEAIQARSFVGRWVHELLFYDAPVWVFTVAYCLFGAIVLTTFLLAPPELRRSPREAL